MFVGMTKCFGHTHACVCMCDNARQRTTNKIQLSPIMWIQGTQLGPSVLAASTSAY